MKKGKILTAFCCIAAILVLSACMAKDNESSATFCGKEVNADFVFASEKGDNTFAIRIKDGGDEITYMVVMHEVNCKEGMKLTKNDFLRRNEKENLFAVVVNNCMLTTPEDEPDKFSEITFELKEYEPMKYATYAVNVVYDDNGTEKSFYGEKKVECK